MHGGVYSARLPDQRIWPSPAPHSDLRRNVRLVQSGVPVDASRLHAPVPALLQSQAYVVDLTEAYEQLAALVREGQTPEPPRPIAEPQRPRGSIRSRWNPPKACCMDQRSWRRSPTCSGSGSRSSSTGRPVPARRTSPGTGPRPDRRRRGQARPVPSVVHLRGLLRRLPAEPAAAAP